MKLRYARWFASVIFALLLPSWVFASGPKMQVLHGFTAGKDGLEPWANLVADDAGNLYGTTVIGGVTTCLGGKGGCGIVFKLSAPSSPGGAWNETILYRFTGGTDGAAPYAGLVFDSQGNLYGTAENGGDFDGICVSGETDLGCGVVFELSPNSDGSWTETTIHAFTGQNGDGAEPVANLVFDASGNLYGTTELGGGCPSTCGSLQGSGIVFELTSNGSQQWTETILYQFMGDTDGGFPVAGLTFDQQGNLYGTTSGEGTYGNGTVYELMPPLLQGLQWTESTLYTFSGTVGAPLGGVIFDNSGNLYGTTSIPDGTVFELAPAGDGTWAESTLYAFGQGHTSMPYAGLVSDKAGNLYGTTLGKFCGGVFRLQNKNGGWNEAELDFSTGTNGPCGPAASLIFGKWGAVYGTTHIGGKCSVHGGCGTVFGILP
jgi:uncharacterized repeat protein (TIGR03803 family)